MVLDLLITVMASNGGSQPLLTGSLGPIRTSKRLAPKQRYQRCKSAHLAESPPSDIDGIGSVSRSKPFIGKLHPSLRLVTVFLAVYLGLGTLCFYLVRHQMKGKKTNVILDAVYFCIVTMTGVGYGDLVPNSVLTKLLACAFVFMGMALVGLILTKGADYLVEKQEILLLKALHRLHNVGPGEIPKEIETHKVRYKFLMVFALLLVFIILGTVFLVAVEKLDMVDAFYCVCSTITTLGYGDKSFSTEAGRAFAIFWILLSTICLAQFFMYLAELNTESRQRSLAKWVLARKITNADLEAADLDRDGVVSAAEFVMYKLKEMGKINQEDISVVMEEFEDLDVDHSGTLSASDLKLVQSSERQP